MATLTKTEIAGLAFSVGFPPIIAGWMAEIALCESGGRTDAVNRANSNGTTDVGLWQINSVHLKSHPTWTESWLKDGKNNASAAMTLFTAAGKKPTPWSSSESCWKPKLESNDPVSGIRDWAGAAADAAGNVLGAAGSVTNPLDAIADVAGVLRGFLEWVSDPTTWKRAALIGVGFGVVVVGVAALARGTEAGQAVESVAITAASKGTVSKPSGGTSAPKDSPPNA